MTDTIEQQYLALMAEILNKFKVVPDRTGTGRARVFGRELRQDLSDGSLPVITTRKINYEHGIEELLWMIKGSSNINDLPENTKPIWKLWAITEKDVDAFIAKFIKSDGGEVDEKMLLELKKNMVDEYSGSIGPMYGHFWRNNPVASESSFFPYGSLQIEHIPSDKVKIFDEEFEEMKFLHRASNEARDPETGELLPLPFDRDHYLRLRYFQNVDQLGEIIRGIKTNPYSGRHVMTAWIPQFTPFEKVLSPQENILIGRGALAACHVLTQFFVEKADDGGPDFVSLKMCQRSCDLALGVCTNLVFYATFLHLVAHCCDLRPKELIWSGGDVHLYANHYDGAVEQVSQKPFQAPKITIDPNVKDLFAIKRSDITVSEYQHHPAIKYPVSM